MTPDPDVTTPILLRGLGAAPPGSSAVPRQLWLDAIVALQVTADDACITRRMGAAWFRADSIFIGVIEVEGGGAGVEPLYRQVQDGAVVLHRSYGQLHGAYLWHFAP